MKHFYLAILAKLLGPPFTTAPATSSSLLPWVTEDLIGLGLGQQCHSLDQFRIGLGQFGN